MRSYVLKKYPRSSDPTMRREHPQGKTPEVDLGSRGLVYDEVEHRPRKAGIFSVRLAYSSKAYQEWVWQQSKEVFFACQQRAFQFFGGVPEEVVPDNLKAAVVQACYTEPLINREYRSLAEPYRFRIHPCQPYKPTQKGGVESDIKYLKLSLWPLVKERAH